MRFGLRPINRPNPTFTVKLFDENKNLHKIVKLTVEVLYACNPIFLCCGPPPNANLNLTSSIMSAAAAGDAKS